MEQLPNWPRNWVVKLSIADRIIHKVEVKSNRRINRGNQRLSTTYLKQSIRIGFEIYQNTQSSVSLFVKGVAILRVSRPGI